MGGRKHKHKRRDGYWRLYDFAHSNELTIVIDELVQLVDEAGDPWTKARRGRKPVHSPRKMAVICVLTVILGFSYRNMETLLHILKLPWQEPVPDHEHHPRCVQPHSRSLPQPDTGEERCVVHCRVRLGQGRRRGGQHRRLDRPLRDRGGEDEEG